MSAPTTALGEPGAHRIAEVFTAVGARIGEIAREHPDELAADVHGALDQLRVVEA